jgi:hypothetical protein
MTRNFALQPSLSDRANTRLVWFRLLVSFDSRDESVRQALEFFSEGILNFHHGAYLCPSFSREQYS